MTPKVTAFAPAKINLTLHVTGQRADGYHLLQSLVVFADVGDRITVSPAQELSLTVTGPLSAGVPTDATNLVLRAAREIGVLGAEITLEKHLPAAAGIGGGSSDAAAALRALHQMTGVDLPKDQGLSLGADVPVCLRAQAALMEGIGEDISPMPELPPLPTVLINPRVDVPTPAVFKALICKDNPAMSVVPQNASFDEFCDWLADQRNDLQAPAIQHAPQITQVLEALQGARLVRMSGSGATCFGLYPDVSQAKAAAAAIQAAHPQWWVTATTLA